MTGFEDRQQGFEAKFAHDANTEFRVMARRNKLAGLWAAKLLGFADAEAETYAKTIVQADFEEAGDEDVIRKLVADLQATDTSEATIREALSALLAEARAQIEAR